MQNQLWQYIISHKWSNDLLRANLLFLILVLLYSLFHFSLQTIGWHLFLKNWCLMNICLFIKQGLNAYDKTFLQ